MEVRISRTWIIFVALLAAVHAFEVRVVPTAARLREWKAGENLLMSCDVTGADGDVTFTWLKGGSPLGPESGRIKTVFMADHRSMRLMIMKPDAGDAGTYVCKAKVGDEEEETTVEVTIITAPKFVDAPLEQHPEEGDSAKIVCRVEADPPAAIVWQRNGETLDKEHKRNYDFEENDQVLVIPEFKSENDDGIYSCMAFQEPNIESREINVTGYSKPQITVFAKEEEQGYEGQSITLTCQGIGKPAPNYKWYKGSPKDKDATPIAATDKYAVGDDGTLVIHALIEDDKGPYTCVASNEVGETEQETDLNVFRKPKISPIENVTATQGMKVELVCKWEGDGKITAKWMFKGETMEAEANTDDEPVSKQIANDDEENADEDDAYADQGGDEDSNNVVLKKKKRHARKGRFNRHIDGEDEEAAEEEEEHQHVTVTAGENSLTLTLVDVRLDDAAEYQCEATNEAGTDNRRVFVAITHAPSMVRKTDEIVRSYDGHTASFFCEVSAVPAPTWTWTGPKGDTILADAENYFVETAENGLKSSLKLKTTRDEHYGSYKCSADNGIGSSVEAEVEVLEVLPPEVPSSLMFEGDHPNFAEIVSEDFSSIAESKKPTDLVLFYATAERASKEGFDWTECDECQTATLKYGDKIVLTNLMPDTEYHIRARSKNEAGESELSDEYTYKTSSPIAPAAPEFTREADAAVEDCGEVCEIKWSEPNNHGADIVRYVLKTTPVEVDDETGESRPIGPDVVTEIDDGRLHEELDGLLPNTVYKIELTAFNEIGASEPSTMMIKTSDDVRSAGGLSLSAIIGIVALVLVALLVIVDIACYLLNRCGVLACICVNCCGQTPTERKSKEVTMEEGAKPESAQLLTAGKGGDSSVSHTMNGNGTSNGTNGHHQPKSHKATTV